MNKDEDVKSMEKDFRFKYSACQQSIEKICESLERGLERKGKKVDKKRNILEMNKRIADLEVQVQSQQSSILEMEKALKAIGWKGNYPCQVPQK